MILSGKSITEIRDVRITSPHSSGFFNIPDNHCLFCENAAHFTASDIHIETTHVKRDESISVRVCPRRPSLERPACARD